MVNVFLSFLSYFTCSFGHFSSTLLIKISYFFFKFPAIFLLLFLSMAFFKLVNLNDNFFD
jgi:hypothetical protein